MRFSAFSHSIKFTKTLLMITSTLQLRSQFLNTCIQNYIAFFIPQSSSCLSWRVICTPTMLMVSNRTYRFINTIHKVPICLQFKKRCLPTNIPQLFMYIVQTRLPPKSWYATWDFLIYPNLYQHYGKYNKFRHSLWP